MNESLDQVRDVIWRILGRFVARARPVDRFVALATVDRENRPRQRTVALRHADPSTAVLHVHTDALSIKVNEIGDNPHVALLAWEPGERVQLRLGGVARIIADPEARDVWDTLDEAARLNYSHHPPPGQALDTPDGYVQRPLPARFAVIEIWVTQIDYVSLADTGHRRAAFSACDGWAGTWLSP